MVPVPSPSSSNVWIHMPWAWKPSTSACWQSARIRSMLQLGARPADDRAGGLGQPDLVGECLALEGGDHRPAGLLGVRLQHRALRLARPPAVDGQVDGEGPAQDAVLVVQRRDQQVERVPGVGRVVDRARRRGPSPRSRRRTGRGARGGRSGRGPSRRPSRSRSSACPREYAGPGARGGPRRCRRPPSPRACRRRGPR